MLTRAGPRLLARSGLQRRAARAAEFAGIAGAAAAIALLVLRVGRAVHGAGDVAVVSLASLAGWVLADLVSGVVHWWADRIASEDLPVLGSHFVRPFREHHEDPDGICRHDFAATNGNTCIAALPLLLGACLWVPPASRGAGALFASAAFLALALWSCLTNQIHKWAHLPCVPAGVSLLQRSRLLLSPAHHARHHAVPFTRCYCITAGWLDSLLDGMGFFGRLERALRRAGAERPVRPASP